MIGLSVPGFVRRRRQQSTEAQPPVRDLAWSIKYQWDTHHSSADFLKYLGLVSNDDDRNFAAFQFLFMGCNDLTNEPNVGLVQHRMVSGFRTAEENIRSLLRQDQYEHGFYQNIVIWGREVEKALAEKEYMAATCPTCVCVTRMAAVERCFRDKLSDDVVEIGIAFLIVEVMTSEISRHVGDNVWARSFEVAKQFAERRPSKGLTLAELVRIRDSALRLRPHLSLVVQRDISALGREGH